MVQLPALTIWICSLTIVATAVFELLYVTVKSLLAVAPGAKSASPYVLVGSASKVIVCESFKVVKVSSEPFVVPSLLTPTTR